MYEAFFGLREKPFALTPNTEYMVRLAPYQACLNLLQVALAEGEGFVKVTGEVGTGKTLLCRELLNRLTAGGYPVAWLPDPALGPQALRQALANELQVADVAFLDDHGLMVALQRRLIELAASGSSAVLLIDEAQALPEATLEALRLLTNLETERRKLLQVVLFGQPELDATLAREDFRQLRQRITFSYQLRPLYETDTARYLQERLAVAGYRGDPLFEPAAVSLLTCGSGGIPRLLNILANKCLMAAFGEGRRTVGVSQVRRALADTEGAHPVRNQRWLVVGGFLLASTAAIGAWLWLSGGPA